MSHSRSSAVIRCLPRGLGLGLGMDGGLACVRSFRGERWGAFVDFPSMEFPMRK